MLRDVTNRDFDHLMKQAGVPVVVELWKPGCGSCRALTRGLEVRSLPVLAIYERGEFARFIGGLGTKEEILKQLRLTYNLSS